MKSAAKSSSASSASALKKKPGGTKPADTGANPEKAGKKAAAAKTLAAEMKVMRSAFKEIVEHFCLRVDSELVEIIRVLEKEQVLNEPMVLPPAKISLQLAKKIRALGLKPNKGKLKDILHVNDLAEKIAKKMPAQP
ncbi:MAG: hypothetical protein HGA76_06535 [Candidatus Firestonebacteria bacterium]|nr:hypothetical protein [Candidatus Firestonebacteria bacterium]